MSVLITAGLSPQAYRLQRILNVMDVVFTDETPLPQIPGTPSFVLPAYNSTGFTHEILKACLDHVVTRVFPLKWGEVIELSKARELFSEYEVMLMIPSDDWLKNNRPNFSGNTEDIIVLEQGRQMAGEVRKDVLPLLRETGVFCRATKEQYLEYSLYLIDDARI